MSDAYTLPDNLTPDEAATLAALRAEAMREADEQAAITIRVRRAERELRPRIGRDGALGEIPKRLPVSMATAERIVKRKGKWSA